MQDGKIGGETVGFRRHPAIPGVEIQDFENSARRWRRYATGFQLFVPRTWEGEIRHGRRQTLVGPGMLFCARPHDVFTTPRILKPGGASAITIEPATLDRYLARYGLRTAGLTLNNVVTMSAPLRAATAAVLDLMHPSTPVVDVQSSLADLVAALLAEPVFEWLGGDVFVPPTGQSDLGRLAEGCRHSRFRRLRVFKQRHGLPPYAYQLLVRIGRAQQALRAGLPAADVAAEQGFVDQSHFTRHFKQLVGVTPRQYVHPDRRLSRRCRAHPAIAYKTAGAVRPIGRT